MSKNELALIPTYWASVSGGKDSLYMLNLILHNLDKYPLNGVVHFELEIDFPFIHDVINYMESECKKHNIPFVRIKPRQSWSELYEKYHFPTSSARWCNSKYKMDAKKQHIKFMKSQGYNTIFYIGYCKDEERRYSDRSVLNERYPLVEEDITEKQILEWAKNVPIFNDYYKFNTRCGCMYCPMMSYKTMAYLLKYYPREYNFMIEKIAETEEYLTKLKGKPVAVKQSNPKYNIQFIDNVVRKKHLPRLENKLKAQQVSLFATENDFILKETKDEDKETY